MNRLLSLQDVDEVVDYYKDDQHQAIYHIAKQLADTMREKERLRGALRMCLGATEQARQETVSAIVQAECIKALSNKESEHG